MRGKIPVLSQKLDNLCFVLNASTNPTIYQIEGKDSVNFLILNVIINEHVKL